MRNALPTANVGAAAGDARSLPQHAPSPGRPIDVRAQYTAFLIRVLLEVVSQLAELRQKIGFYGMISKQNM